MEVIQISSSQFETLVGELQALKEAINNRGGFRSDRDLLDNAEFMRLMRISQRTAQAWRDSGVIGYSKIGNKVYYRMRDVEGLFERFYIRRK